MADDDNGVLAPNEIAILQKLGVDVSRFLDKKPYFLITLTRCETCNGIVEKWFRMLPQLNGDTFVSQPIMERPTKYKLQHYTIRTCPLCEEYFMNMPHEQLVRWIMRKVNNEPNPGGQDV